MNSRSVAAGLAIAAMSVGLAACGSSSKTSDDQAVTATFKAGYAKQRTVLNETFDELGQIVSGASERTDAQLQSDLRAVESKYHLQLARLETLKPPAKLTSQFAAVTAVGRKLDDDLNKMVAAVAGHDAAAAKASTKQLVAHSAPLNAATAKLGKALGLPPTADSKDGPASTSTTASASSGGTIATSYETPTDADGRAAKQILKLGGTDGIAAGLSHSFVLPVDMKIHIVNGFVGPSYDPSTKTITLSYGFVNYVGEQLTKNFPELLKNQNELGRELAAVDGFILLHEFGHALIDVFGLPILGKEEDAADSVATVFLTQNVKGGTEYAFDAAKFFHTLSARQRKLAPAAYFDEHSLDEQRAYAIVCWIAGSSESDFNHVRKLGLLSDARLQSCPSEYQQKVRSWDTLLEPHVRG
jgi:hypothetical protein